MTVDIPVFNLIIGVIAPVVTAAFILALGVYFKFVKLKSSVGLLLIFAFLMAGLSYNKSGPRVVLTDETPTASIPEPGEIRSLKPDQMTDQERLEYNQKLINQNKPPKHQ